MRKLTLTSAVIVGALLLTNCNGPVSTQEVPTTTKPLTTTTTPTTTTTTVAPTTTTIITLPEGFYMPALDADVPCQEWAQTALDAGWRWDLLPELLREVWSESRCLNIIPGHKNWNGHDYGPLQINQVWSNEVEDFFGNWDMIQDPLVNFTWAWEMYKWHDHHKGCGFIPWSRKCD